MGDSVGVASSPIFPCNNSVISSFSRSLGGTLFMALISSGSARNGASCVSSLGGYQRLFAFTGTLALHLRFARQVLDLVFLAADVKHERMLQVILRQRRSEEHTSELQSLTNLVCRLLLEKKKINKALKCDTPTDQSKQLYRRCR